MIPIWLTVRHCVLQESRGWCANISLPEATSENNSVISHHATYVGATVFSSSSVSKVNKPDKKSSRKSGCTVSIDEY